MFRAQLFLAVACGILIVSGGGVARDDDQEAIAIPIERWRNVSDQHFQTIRDMVDRIPDSWKRFIRDRGIRVVVLRRLDEAGLFHRPASAASWSEVRGTFVLVNGRQAAIYLPEFYVWEGTRAKVPDRVGVLLHELGHAYDLIRGRHSYSADFRRAYEADKKALTGELPVGFQHYLGDGASGPKEVFAESMCILLRGAVARQTESAAAPREAAFRRAFPLCLRQVESLMADMAAK